MFDMVPSSHSGIDFANTLVPTEHLNTYVFRNFYNGGGVAIGDVNNDGYADIFFSGNQVANRLYINKGDFTFEEITREAGLTSQGAWTTGVSMVDVNGDGWLDIYICKSGPPGGERRHNELFMNNGDNTFTEKAGEYGVDVIGLSIHASFLDYDKDGDLDLYLLSNPIRSLDDLQPRKGLRDIPVPDGGNRFFRNDLISVAVRESADTGDGGFHRNGVLPTDNGVAFTDVTHRVGIYSSKIGFGLGVSVSDVNRDGWPDIYISNDFFERDYLYLNSRDGAFIEVLPQSMHAISLSSMGGDIADLNHDGYPEIFISDMLPEVEKRLKSKISFGSWDEYSASVEQGYHHQFTRNTLQLNHGPAPPQSGRRRAMPPSVYFSEIGRLAGVDASDWSWGGLIADFDLDGHRDLYIPNGIYRDLLDQGFIAEMSDPEALRSIMRNQSEPIMKIVDRIPSNPIANYMFAGSAMLQFSNVAEKWGLSEPSFSNGAAYGDLDNDGDLDLVVNNVNMGAFVYRNRASDLHPERGWLQVDLDGPFPNTFAVGAQLTAWSDNRLWYVEQQPIRGFQSTVDHTLHLGFGEVSSGRLDSLVVRWPDGDIVRLEDIELNQRLQLRYSGRDAASEREPLSKSATSTEAKGTTRHSGPDVRPVVARSAISSPFGNQ